MRKNQLHPVGGRAACLRSSLYADDTAIFVAPVHEDIMRLTAILHGFGEVTGLAANLEKTLVAPIGCADINLDAVLDSFPAKRATSP